MGRKLEHHLQLEEELEQNTAGGPPSADAAVETIWTCAVGFYTKSTDSFWIALEMNDFDLYDGTFNKKDIVKNVEDILCVVGKLLNVG